MRSQADFNFYAVQAAILVFLIWWFFAPIRKWVLARYEIAHAAYLKVSDRRKRLETNRDLDLNARDEGQWPETMEVEIDKKQEHFTGQNVRQRKGKYAKMQELSAAKLLETVVSSDSDASSEEAEVHDEPGHHDHHDKDESHQGKGAKGSLLSRSSEVSIMHELRPGKADQAALDAVRILSLELFECDVWEVISNKNRLKVSSCLRWTGCDWQALGLVLYKVQQHVLQVVYVGVSIECRRQHVGRALVKSVKELSRKDLSCSSAVAVVQKNISPEAVMFFRAVGFKKEELKGGDGEKVFLRMEMKRQGKRKSEGSGSSSQGGLSLLLWEEVLAQAKYFAKRYGKESKAEQEKSEIRSVKTQEFGEPEEAQLDEEDPDLAGAMAAARESEPVVEQLQQVQQTEPADELPPSTSRSLDFPQDACMLGAEQEPQARKTGAKAAAKVVAATPSKAMLPGHVPELKAQEPAPDSVNAAKSLRGSRRTTKPPDWMPTLRPRSLQ